MEPFRNVLVAVDVMSGALAEDGPLPREVETLLAAAVDCRDIMGARLTVMTVVDAQGTPEVLEELEGLARERLEQRVLPALGADVSAIVASGRPAVTIIRRVQQDGFDLVLAAARKSGIMHRAIAGSVTIQLLRKCPCPVVITPRKRSSPPYVLVTAVALHELTSKVLEISALVCQLRKADEWHVFYCPEYPLEGGMRLRNTPREEIEEYERSEREKAWKALHEMADPLESVAGRKPRLWMSEGLPSEQIILATERLHADLLVMGTIGRSGLAGVVVGNTADKVFARLECAVLAVKPDGFRCPIDA